MYLPDEDMRWFDKDNGTTWATAAYSWLENLDDHHEPCCTSGATHHRGLPVYTNGLWEFVDAALAPVVYELFRAGIGVESCCEDPFDNRPEAERMVTLGFPDTTDAQTFLTLVLQQGSPSSNGFYARVTGDSSGDEGWYRRGSWMWALMVAMNGRKASLQPRVALPYTDLAEVVIRLQAANL